MTTTTVRPHGAARSRPSHPNRPSPRPVASRLHASARGDAGPPGTATSNVKVGVFYSTGTMTTQKIARRIADGLGEACDAPMPINTTHAPDLAAYDALVFGAPSYLWEKHRVSALDFDTIEPTFGNTRDLEGKRVAVFGLGDQEGYPKNFCDAIGILFDHFQLRGADMVGWTENEGYDFKRSRALKQGRLCGLALDPHTQNDLTDARVKAWVAQIAQEFGLDDA